MLEEVKICLSRRSVGIRSEGKGGDKLAAEGVGRIWGQTAGAANVVRTWRRI